MNNQNQEETYIKAFRRSKPGLNKFYYLLILLILIIIIFIFINKSEQETTQSEEPIIPTEEVETPPPISNIPPPPEETQQSTTPIPEKAILESPEEKGEFPDLDITSKNPEGAPPPPV